MVQGIGAASSVQSLQAAPPRQVVSSGTLADPASPFDIAQQIQEVQVNNLKLTLDAQSQVLDLLV